MTSLGYGQLLPKTNIEQNFNKQGLNGNQGGRRLVWFRTLAFQANDPGFKSRRPHLNHIFRDQIMKLRDRMFS